MRQPEQNIQQSNRQPQPILFKLNWKYIILGLLSVLIIGALGFWAGRQSVSPVAPKITLPIEISTSPVPTSQTQISQPTLIPNDLADKKICNINSDCIHSCGSDGVGRGGCFNKKYINIKDNFKSIDNICCICENCTVCTSCKCIDNTCTNVEAEGDCC